MHMNVIKLKRWNKGLGKSEYCEYSGNSLISLNEKPEIIHGAYASYKEGDFCAWLKNDDLFVSWNGEIYPIHECNEVEWVSKVGYRQLQIKSNNRVVLSFKYYTFIKNIIEYSLDVIFMDDDWGLVNDLPSFIESCFNNRDYSSLSKYAESI